MEFYGRHFDFGGVNSRIYSLIFAGIETSEYESLHGEHTGVKVFNRTNNTNYLIDDDFSSSPLVFDVEIVNENGEAIDREKIREIEKWLFKSKCYRKLYVDISDDDEGRTYEYKNGKMLKTYLNCRLINPIKIERYDGIVGFKAKLEADSNMFWQDEIEEVFELELPPEPEEVVPPEDVPEEGGNEPVEEPIGEPTDPPVEEQPEQEGELDPADEQGEAQVEHDIEGTDMSSEFATEFMTAITPKNYIYVNVDTDSEEYIYPVVKVIMGNGGGSFYIKNATDSIDRETKFVDIGSNATVVMHGDTRQITDSQYYEKFAKRNFVRLIDGTNRLIVGGNVASVTIRYSARRSL